MSTISPPTQVSSTSETGTHSPTTTATDNYIPPILSVASSIWGTGPATTVLNAGVLPTDFVLDPACSSLRNLVASSVVTAGTTELQWQWFYADKCDTAAHPETQCLPQGFDTNYGYQLTASSVQAYMPVYSEGSSCPNGYTSACEVVTTNIWFINAGETNTVAVGCCPRSVFFSCSTHASYVCRVDRIANLGMQCTVIINAAARDCLVRRIPRRALRYKEAAKADSLLPGRPLSPKRTKVSAARRALYIWRPDRMVLDRLGSQGASKRPSSYPFFSQSSSAAPPFTCFTDAEGGRGEKMRQQTMYWSWRATRSQLKQRRMPSLRNA